MPRRTLKPAAKVTDKEPVRQSKRQRKESPWQQSPTDYEKSPYTKAKKRALGRGKSIPTILAELQKSKEMSAGDQERDDQGAFASRSRIQRTPTRDWADMSGVSAIGETPAPFQGANPQVLREQPPTEYELARRQLTGQTTPSTTATAAHVAARPDTPFLGQSYSGPHQEPKTSDAHVGPGGGASTTADNTLVAQGGLEHNVPLRPGYSADTSANSKAPASTGSAGPSGNTQETPGENPKQGPPPTYGIVDDPSDPRRLIEKLKPPKTVKTKGNSRQAGKGKSIPTPGQKQAMADVERLGLYFVELFDEAGQQLAQIKRDFKSKRSLTLDYLTEQSQNLQLYVSHFEETMDEYMLACGASLQSPSADIKRVYDRCYNASMQYLTKMLRMIKDQELLANKGDSHREGLGAPLIPPGTLSNPNPVGQVSEQPSEAGSFSSESSRADRSFPPQQSLAAPPPGHITVNQGGRIVTMSIANYTQKEAELSQQEFYRQKIERNNYLRQLQPGMEDTSLPKDWRTAYLNKTFEIPSHTHNTSRLPDTSKPPPTVQAPAPWRAQSKQVTFSSYDTYRDPLAPRENLDTSQKQAWNALVRDYYESVKALATQVDTMKAAISGMEPTEVVQAAQQKALFAMGRYQARREALLTLVPASSLPGEDSDTYHEAKDLLHALRELVSHREISAKTDSPSVSILKRNNVLTPPTPAKPTADPAAQPTLQQNNRNAFWKDVGDTAPGPGVKPNIKMEPIALVKFDGWDDSQYFTFRENFRTFVHENTTVSFHEKWARLCSLTMGGPAHYAVANKQASYETYIAALEELDAHYGNEERHLSYLLAQLKALPPMNKKSYESLMLCQSEVRNVFLQITYMHGQQALHNGQFDTFVFSCLNVDPATQEHMDSWLVNRGLISFNFHQFNHYVKAVLGLHRNKMATKGQFLKDKNKRYKAIHTLQTEQPVMHASVEPALLPTPDDSLEEELIDLTDEVHLLQVMPDKKGTYAACPQCRGNHALPECPAFLAMTDQNRMTKLHRIRACFKCLLGIHSFADCTQQAVCKVCKGNDHHTLIHKVWKKKPQPNKPTNQAPIQYHDPIADSTAAQLNDMHNSLAHIQQQLHSLSVEDGEQIAMTVTTPNAPHPKQGGKRTRQNAPVYRGQNMPSQSMPTICFNVVPVYISNPKRPNSKVLVNVFVDSGAQNSYIRESVAKRLGLEGPRDDQLLRMLTTTRWIPSKIVSMNMATINGEEYEFVAHTTPKIPDTIKMPPINMLKKKFQELAKLHFPDFATNRIADIILGIDQFELMKVQRIVHDKLNEPYVVDIKLGRVVTYSNQVFKSQEPVNLMHTAVIPSQAYQVESNYPPPCDACGGHNGPAPEIIKAIWEPDRVDTYPATETKRMSINEQKALDILNRTVTRLSSRAIQMDLMWRDGEPAFRSNRLKVLKDTSALEKRLLLWQPDTYHKTKAEIEEWLELGFIRILDPDLDDLDDGRYLDWLLVIRLDKPSMPVRLVFDGARKHDGKSLNDALLPGPKLQSDVHNVLLRARAAPILVVADISKMFLRFKVDPASRKFQRFIWQGNHYEASSVVFGTASAPCMATFAIKHHIANYQNSHPLGYKALNESLYVDDLVAGFETEAQAIQAIKEIREIGEQADLTFRKWGSSHPAVLEDVPEELRIAGVAIEPNESHVTKALGLYIDTVSDQIIYPPIPDNNEGKPTTLRSMTKYVPTQYDPLGLIDPITLRGALLLQRVHMARRTIPIDWDTALDYIEDDGVQDIVRDFAQYIADNQHMELLRFPRTARTHYANSVQLHIFVDASELALAAVAYMRVTYPNDDVEVTIIGSRKQVKPLKEVRAISLMELNAAVLGAMYAHNLVRELDRVDKVVFWTDSTCVLTWISKPACSWAQYVGRRVTKICEAVGDWPWRKVSTKCNPADYATRTCTPRELAASTLWIRGPDYLKRKEEEWPVSKIKPSDDELAAVISQNAEKLKPLKAMKAKPAVAMTLFVIPPHLQPSESVAYKWKCYKSLNALDVSRYSNYDHMVRIWARAKRFMQRGLFKFRGPLFPEEVKRAEVQLVATQQQKYLGEEFAYFLRNKSWPPKSTLAPLDPIIGYYGEFRTKGRLANSKVQWIGRQQLILVGPMAKAFLNKIHRQVGCGYGTARYLCDAQITHHVVSANKLMKSILKRCGICQRRKAMAVPPHMGLLPANAIPLTDLLPFKYVGTDFCGPFRVSFLRSTYDMYVAIFICRHTKAIHVEEVYDLTTAELSRALERFVARRGTPYLLRSDGGSNYIGLRNDIAENDRYHEMVDKLRHISWEELRQYGAQIGVLHWTLSPPHTPHANGLVEAAVKIFKKTFYRYFCANVTPMELFKTLIVKAEGFINGRPLGQIEGMIITPNHFLTKGPPGDLVPVIDPADVTRRDLVLKQTHACLQEMWKYWTKHIIHNMKKLGTWKNHRAAIQPGDIVIVLDKELFKKRFQWPVARVHRTYEDSDGIARRAFIRMMVPHSDTPVFYEKSVEVLIPLHCAEPDDTQEVLSKIAVARNSVQLHPEDLAAAQDQTSDYFDSIEFQRLRDALGRNTAVAQNLAPENRSMLPAPLQTKRKTKPVSRLIEEI